MAIRASFGIDKEMPSKMSLGPKDFDKLLAVITDIAGSIPFSYTFDGSLCKIFEQSMFREEPCVVE